MSTASGAARARGVVARRRRGGGVGVGADQRVMLTKTKSSATTIKRRGTKTSVAASASVMITASLSMSSTTSVKRRGEVTVANAWSPGGSSSDDGWDKDEQVELVAGPGSSVESDALSADLRDKTLKAIEKGGYRVTVGDASSLSGASVFDTQRALNALAADTGASLEVSSAGDLTYVFPRSTRGILGSKSFKMRMEPLVNGTKNFASYLFRVAFGTSLVASVMIVYTAIFALLSSKSNDDRDSSRRGGPSFYISPYDLFWYWDPYYYRRRHRRDREMNFFEAVFSFVFGDGDPNLEFEKKRWELVGKAIQKNKGVVTAEQLAPYLDAAGYEDESFVLPALTRFEGTPEVNSVTGSIIYRFPNMETTARRGSFSSRRSESDALAQEERWAFSLADSGQKVQATLLGVANLVGVVILSNMINDPNIMYRTRDYIALAGALKGLLPWLQAYGVMFFVVPVLRFLRNAKKNKDIDDRNNSRLLAARRIASPEPRLAAKLAAAANASSQRTVEEAIYTSGEGSSAKAELDDFDRRLRVREDKA
jgi:hypothetical protein